MFAYHISTGAHPRQTGRAYSHVILTMQRGGGPALDAIVGPEIGLPVASAARTRKRLSREEPVSCGPTKIRTWDQRI
jgi:hypothetical protein